MGRGSPVDKASDSESEGPGFETRCHQRPTEYKWIAEYVLVKSVGPKVLTPRSVRCRSKVRWVPAQVSTSSLDLGSKLRGVRWCCHLPSKVGLPPLRALGS